MTWKWSDSHCVNNKSATLLSLHTFITVILSFFAGKFSRASHDSQMQDKWRNSNLDVFIFKPYHFKIVYTVPRKRWGNRADMEYWYIIYWLVKESTTKTVFVTVRLIGSHLPSTLILKNLACLFKFINQKVNYFSTNFNFKVFDLKSN